MALQESGTSNARSQQNLIELARRIAQEHGVPEDLALAIVQQESSFNPDAKNEESGASGLMQLMPATAKSYGVTDPFHPVQNLQGGMQFLSDLGRKYTWSEDGLPKVVAAYFAGEGAVDGGNPLGPRTNAYVEAVLGSLGQSARTEQWIYPTPELQRQAAAAGEEHYGDPKFEGALISYPTGAEITEDDINAIFNELDPQGLVTRESVPGLLGGLTSVGAGVRSLMGPFAGMARGARRIASRAAPMAIPGLVGLATGAGELYRQSQVPREFDEGKIVLESWPRSSYGLPYEGAPDTASEKAYATFIRGLSEAGAELVGDAVLGNVFRTAGRWYQGTGFSPAQALRTGIDIDRGVGTSAQALAGTRSLPTAQSVRNAKATVQASADTAGETIRQAETAASLAGNPDATRVSVNDLYRRAQNIYDGPGDLTRSAVAGAMGRSATPRRIQEGFESLLLGDISGDLMGRIELRDAAAILREANSNAVGYFKGLQTIADVTPDDARQYAAIAQAARESVEGALKHVDGINPAALRDAMQQMGRRKTRPDFFRNWSNQNSVMHDALTAASIAESAAKTPAGGLPAGWFASTALGGATGGIPGSLAGAAVGSQLVPSVRALMGRTLSDIGTANIVPNVARGIEGLMSGPTPPQFGQQRPVGPQSRQSPLSPESIFRASQAYQAGPAQTPTAPSPLGSPENPLELTLTGSPQARLRRRRLPRG
jgi:hypothetical protein